MRAMLIGDSIRMNAEPYVRERLPSGIRLASPSVNCESSHKVLAHIRQWLPMGSADAVHINCGLHDIRYDPGRDRPISTAQEYATNLRTIFAYLSECAAQVIWATSTPIDEDAHNRNKMSRRYRADLLEYNRISLELARDFGFRIHDLHARLRRTSLERILSPDGVHFNRTGNALIGRYIADEIAASQRG